MIVSRLSCKLWILMETYGNLVRENLWELMGTYGNLWNLVRGNLWELNNNKTILKRRIMA